MKPYLLQLLTISVAINVLLFLIAFKRQSDKLTDASYAVSFIAVVTCGLYLSGGNKFNYLGFLMVLIWALRIGGFLLYRILRKGVDHRFDGMRENFWKFSKFWIGQAITVWVLLIPLILAYKSHGNISKIAVVGFSIWAIGLLIETIADFQKYRFSQVTANRGKWIETGLWQYSRHPNYFGEIIVWVGIYIFCFANLGYINRVVGLVSPLLITVLLVFVSGIPLLEKSAQKKWGNNPDFIKHKKRTSLLLILPNK